jgi:hypothetical protein
MHAEHCRCGLAASRCCVAVLLLNETLTAVAGFRSDPQVGQSWRLQSKALHCRAQQSTQMVSGMHELITRLLTRGAVLLPSCCLADAWEIKAGTLQKWYGCLAVLCGCAAAE